MISTEVIERIDDTPSVSTLKFRWDARVEAGQFIMIWVPGTGEVPMSLSSTGEPKSVTVKAYGETSTAIRNLKPGEKIFFRGPYGNTFTETDGKILLVGGGSGMASLIPLFREGCKAVVSARTKEELLFADRFADGHVYRVTDDGSSGIKGTPVDQLRNMDLTEFDMIYVCGPELMLMSVMHYLSPLNLKAEFSLERIMKCGIGICDSCSIDGKQLCRDGPVFGIDEVSAMEEFGVSRLTESGRRVKL